MGNSYLPNKNTRVTYYDVMRIIAIFLVVFNHLRGYSLYSISSGWKQWIYFFMTMITRINVPLFLMVSGALILGTHTQMFQRIQV